MGKAPDLLYCISLLEEEGVCCVPGSGFGQKAGTYHFRTTFLPAEDKMAEMPERIARHHSFFLTKMAAAAAKL